MLNIRLSGIHQRRCVEVAKVMLDETGNRSAITHVPFFKVTGALFEWFSLVKVELKLRAG